MFFEKRQITVIFYNVYKTLINQEIRLNMWISHRPDEISISQSMVITNKNEVGQSVDKGTSKQA